MTVLLVLVLWLSGAEFSWGWILLVLVALLRDIDDRAVRL